MLFPLKWTSSMPDGIELKEILTYYIEATFFLETKVVL